ncbi:MAG TPA: PQQ-binding-like beta-propeller repeat protein, partial [Methanocellaceae archaeon]
MKKGMLFEAVAVLLLITLVFILYVMIATGGPSTSGEWTLSGVIVNPGNGIYGNNMFTGDDGILYTVDGKNVDAIGPDGNIRWSLAIPNLLNDTTIEAWVGQRSATDNGTLYIELSPVTNNSVHNAALNGEIISISPQGDLIWGEPSTPGFSANAGRLYLLYNDPAYMIVYNANGTEAWRASDVRSMPAFDNNGTAYLVKGLSGYEVDACTPGGIYLWHIDTSEYGMGAMWSYNPESIFYYNHTILLPFQEGLVALNQDGSLKWKAPYDQSSILLDVQPIDSGGNIYFRDGYRIFYVSPDGVESTVTGSFVPYASPASSTIMMAPSPSGIVDMKNGIAYSYRLLYAYNNSPNLGFLAHDALENDMAMPGPWDLNFFGNRTLDQLDMVRVNASSLVSGNELWSCELPVDEHTVTLTESNYRDLVAYGDGIEND